MTWRYVFDEDGGYDCMSAAYEVYAGEELVCRIDLADHGEPRNFNPNPAARVKVEQLAALICAAVNAYREAK